MRRDDIEYMEQYYYCLIEPTKAEEEEYLERFATLPNKDKAIAMIKSKEWGDFALTNKMQQYM